MGRMSICFLCVILIMLSLCACCVVEKTPTIESVNKLYSDYKEEIDTVVNFLASAEYAVIIISEYDGTMQADFQRIEIPDPNAREAIKHLIDEEIVEVFYKDNCNIEFNIWTHKETRYWIACSTDDTVPSVQYATKVIPMVEDGWYYVIASYSEWRNARQGTVCVNPNEGNKGTVLCLEVK